jgi:DNA polymerase-3 subunit chi
LWQRVADSFLAHGYAGGAHDARQPILLGAEPQAANGARFCVLADGQWREVEGMERVFLLFAPERIDGARQAWRMLGQREGVDRHYWRQDGGKWREGP